MNMAVGVRRAVVKNKLLPALGCLPDRIIEAGFDPIA